jgi:hypothetical protein
MSGNLEDLSTSDVQEEEQSSKEVKTKGNIFAYFYIAQLFEFLFIVCVNCMKCVFIGFFLHRNQILHHRMVNA